MNKANHNTPETSSLACFTMTCHSCRNECELSVRIKDEIIKIAGNGCRRSAVSVRKELEKNGRENTKLNMTNEN